MFPKNCFERAFIKPLAHNIKSSKYLHYTARLWDDNDHNPQQKGSTLCSVVAYYVLIRGEWFDWCRRWRWQIARGFPHADPGMKTCVGVEGRPGAPTPLQVLGFEVDCAPEDLSRIYRATRGHYVCPPRRNWSVMASAICLRPGRRRASRRSLVPPP